MAKKWRMTLPTTRLPLVSLSFVLVLAISSSAVSSFVLQQQSIAWPFYLKDVTGYEMRNNCRCTVQEKSRSNVVGTHLHLSNNENDDGKCSDENDGLKFKRSKIGGGSGNNNNGDDDDESKINSVVKDIYGDRSPLLNLQKKSILFDMPDNGGEISSSSSKKSSPFLTLWQSAKSTLPPVVTGAYKRREDTITEDPAAKLYNLIFVRVPTIVAGLIYIKNELTGHPFTIDFGYGPFDVNPLIVLCLLAWILR